MAEPARPTLLLDLDGTLIDSAPDLAAALNRLMAERGLAPFTRAETARMVGDGVQRLVERAFAARGRVPDAADVAHYTDDYARHCACGSRPFPGVARTLRGLRQAGWRLGVCTNKLEGVARRLLAAFDLAGLFDAVGGGDSFPVRKPDPAHVLATLGASGGVRERAVMAGDHRNDVLAAHGAGLACVFAGWGYGTAEMAAEADAVAARFAELPDMAGRLLGLRSGRSPPPGPLRKGRGS
ncbi:MAG TPA: HAD hydrolase-like protein [Acetobacteraceae bacterium]|nr:HAD hydrolase-like protein [Acetobacteraceae bacterium]